MKFAIWKRKSNVMFSLGMLLVPSIYDSEKLPPAFSPTVHYLTHFTKNPVFTWNKITLNKNLIFSTETFRDC